MLVRSRRHGRENLEAVGAGTDYGEVSRKEPSPLACWSYASRVFGHRSRSYSRPARHLAPSSRDRPRTPDLSLPGPRLPADGRARKAAGEGDGVVCINRSRTAPTDLHFYRLAVSRHRENGGSRWLFSSNDTTLNLWKLLRAFSAPYLGSA